MLDFSVISFTFLSGLEEIKDEFMSWDWNFGKTPSFVVKKKVKLGGVEGVELSIQVEKGRLDNVSLKLPPSHHWNNSNSDTIKVLSNSLIINFFNSYNLQKQSI